MNPPIVTRETKRHFGTGCWTEQLLAREAAPHTMENKLRFPPHSGMPGVETSLSAMLTHVHEGVRIEQVVKWMSTDVAECYQMIGKGKLEEGYDGDIVLVDLNKKIVVEDENTWTQ